MRVMPLWLATALMSVGAVVLGAALRNGDWAAVGIALAAGVATAAYVRGYYTTSVLDRSRGRVVIETVKRRGMGTFNPSIVEPTESVAHEAIDEAVPGETLWRIAPFALLLL